MQSLLFCTVLFVLVNSHTQYVEKEETAGRFYTLQNGDDYSFEYPFDLNAPGTLASGPNAMEDARFVSAYLDDDDSDWIKFNITVANSTANAAAWTPACEESRNIYVNVALLGRTTDPRFQTLTAAQASQYNINWRSKIPAGYGVILGINTPPANPYTRPTLLITLPPGEIPNRWFLPYNSGELDPEANAFRRYQNDNSTGKGGCLFPPIRCVGSPYPFNQTNPFCPHYKVGNFCGPKPWRWINEVDLPVGTYYVVFWERNGRPTDVGYALGWNEALRFGTLTGNPGCSNPFTAPPACKCGSKISFELPPGCVADYPAARERTKTIYSLLTGQANWHRRCTPAPEVPSP